MASDRIKSLRAALIKKGYRISGYKEYLEKETIYLGRGYSQRTIIAAAKKLGFTDVAPSGTRSIALPKLEKHQKVVIKKNTAEKMSCMIVQKTIVDLLNGVTEESRLEIIDLVLDSLDTKSRRVFLEKCIHKELCN